MKKQDKNKTIDKTENETVLATDIVGLYVIKRPIFSDERGFFHEIYRFEDLHRVGGMDFNPVQWSHSQSLPRVIRALHSEKWQKIVYPVSGYMFAAIADVRPESKTFGRVLTFEFNCGDPETERAALFLPPGVGNSICVIGDKPVNYVYLVDEYWDNSKAQGIAWDDPDLAIAWPVRDPIISERDLNNPTLRELYPEKFIK